uniref:Uncharacterized protein n=1 Tax=Rhizophora mucronata TaxID=61149 RepID=A0A2P2LVR2_RHIMU
MKGIKFKPLIPALKIQHRE